MHFTHKINHIQQASQIHNSAGDSVGCHLQAASYPPRRLQNRLSYYCQLTLAPFSSILSCPETLALTFNPQIAVLATM